MEIASIFHFPVTREKSMREVAVSDIGKLLQFWASVTIQKLEFYSTFVYDNFIDFRLLIPSISTEELRKTGSVRGQELAKKRNDRLLIFNRTIHYPRNFLSCDTVFLMDCVYFTLVSRENLNLKGKRSAVTSRKIYCTREQRKFRRFFMLKL